MISNFKNSLKSIIPTELLELALEKGTDKLELVTRHEFDIQTKVLARTRAKLDKISEQLTELEKIL